VTEFVDRNGEEEHGQKPSPTAVRHRRSQRAGATLLSPNSIASPAISTSFRA
jgi:hypothetical protein